MIFYERFSKVKVWEPFGRDLPLSVECMALALFWIKKESIKHSVAFMFRDATPYYLQAIISFSLAIFLYFEMGNVILLKNTISTCQ